MSEEWYHGERTDPTHYPPPGTKPYATVLPPPEPALWAQCREYLSGRGLNSVLARMNGWYGARINGVPRLVIPAVSGDAANRYWQARALDDSKPRYESPHGVSRGDAIGIVWPRRSISALAIVEGPLDALAAAGEGVLGLALMGLTPPEPVIRFLQSLVGPLAASRSVLFMADSTHLAGMAAIARLIGLGGVLVDPYPFKDLAEAPRAERRRLLAV